MLLMNRLTAQSVAARYCLGEGMDVGSFEVQALPTPTPMP